ncbi:hypothetical protein GCM10007315_02390 [Gemmobacter tilapiae]|uniref:Uncharacterized protein n=1 Tax=Neogemmobacter tilapiae TaxID=875041 RepID=A0A918TFY5_9RHOB|nr:hypothetical protein GCM10007315_02390 [Gemmobacter tilapiae]
MAHGVVGLIVAHFPKPHELHQRRFGRNLGLGLSLAAFVALVFALTVVKVTGGDPMAAMSGQTQGVTGPIKGAQP